MRNYKTHLTAPYRHWAQYVWEGLEVSHCCQQSVASRRESKEQATATTLTATKEDKSIDSGIVTCLEEMVPC